MNNFSDNGVIGKFFNIASGISILPLKISFKEISKMQKAMGATSASNSRKGLFRTYRSSRCCRIAHDITIRQNGSNGIGSFFFLLQKKRINIVLNILLAAHFHQLPFFLGNGTEHGGITVFCLQSG